jgi:hypothetical protein
MDSMSNSLGVNLHIPVTKTFDVVVAGGGPSGTAAALAARRAGASVLLIEGEGQLGGIATSGLVSQWLGGRTYDCNRWVVGGIFRELSEEGVPRGITVIPQPPGNGHSPHGWDGSNGGPLTSGIPLDPCGMARLYDEKMAHAGVDVLLKSQAFDVVVNKGRIDHILFLNKSGIQAASAAVFVDATGDADVAFRSGCETVLGREEDRLMTPVTLQVHMDRIDHEALADYINRNGAPRFLKEIQSWQDEGIWPFPWNRFISVQLVDEDTFMINSSRLIGIDGTRGESVSEGFQRGREESYALLDIMRQRIPGCARARIKAFGSQLGVRETRRIKGHYTMTVADLVEGVEFADTIGFSSYGWDLPDPKKPSVQPMEKTVPKRRTSITPLPYRCLLPRAISNLICAGRMMSVERDVLGPVRVMAPCMAMGEAAGHAAALAVKGDGVFANVDTSRLRSELHAAGAIVDFEE